MKMKRKATLLIGVMVLALVLAAGVALAATVNCTAGVTCNGTPQDDKITGTNSADTINALAGNDEVIGLDGSDFISLGDGSDFVDGFGGNDTILGGPNGDNKIPTQFTYDPQIKGLMGAEDSDTVYGEGGADFIDLASFDTPGSHDFASGGRGNDTIHARDNKQDTITCGRGTRDHVYYDQGLDSVSRSCEKKHPNQVPPGFTQPTATTQQAGAERPAPE